MNTESMLAMLGLPQIIPEPEVAQRALSGIYCRTLAEITARLINDNEPLLRANAEGATVTVREIGDGTAMQFTIQAREQEG